MEMTNLDWCDIKYFKPSEFKEPNKMNKFFVFRLDKLRDFIGKPIVIHSDYREGDIGYHGKGEAVDFHVKELNIVDAYLLIEKSGLFNGIGIYPNWNNPGFHVDMRSEPARWGSWSKRQPNVYEALDADFIDRLCFEHL